MVANYFSGMLLRIALLLTTLKLNGISQLLLEKKQTLLLQHTLKKIKRSQFKKVQKTDILLLKERQLLRAGDVSNRASVLAYQDSPFIQPGYAWHLG